MKNDEAYKLLDGVLHCNMQQYLADQEMKETLAKAIGEPLDKVNGMTMRKTTATIEAMWGSMATHYHASAAVWALATPYLEEALRRRTGEPAREPEPGTVRMPFDLTVTDYWRAAIELTPENEVYVDATHKDLADVGIDPDTSVLDVIVAGALMNNDKGDTIMYDLLVEPFM